MQNTKDINAYSEDIKKALAHPQFTFFRKKPTLENLQITVSLGKVCEVVIDARTLRGTQGFSLHRPVVLDIIDREIIFYDPAVGPNCKASIATFQKAWLEAVSNPELCIYETLHD